MPLPDIIKLHEKGAVTYEDPYTKKPGVSICLNKFFLTDNTIADSLNGIKHALEEVDTWPEGQPTPSELVDEVASYLEAELLYHNIMSDKEEYHLIISPIADGKLQWFPDRSIGETYLVKRQSWFLRLVFTK